MALTKVQKDFVIGRLKNQWQQVRLKCDGFEVALGLVQVTDSKLAVSIYIDDYFKGAWIIKPNDHVESKFLPIRTKSVYSPARKKQILKEFGKRNSYKYFPDLDKKIESKGTHFSSGHAALNHLVKVSDSIELITEMPA
ncbi:hypothetical protein DX910_14540 [Acinetobacter haemolyticus]|nr:hypothetical protein DX910_14540 [Acinetobacter haemolyticus]